MLASVIDETMKADRTGSCEVPVPGRLHPRWSDAPAGSLGALLDWVEACGDAVVAVDRAGRILYANRAFERTFALAACPAQAGAAARGEPLSARVPLLSGPRLARWMGETASASDAGPPRVHRLLAEGLRGDGGRFLLSATLMRPRGTAHGSPDAASALSCIAGLRAVDALRSPWDIRLPDAQGAPAEPAPAGGDGVALGPLLDAAIRSLPAADRHRRCEVSLHAPGQHLPVDPDRVRHALVQLLANACRFSTPDTPIRIHSRGDTADGARYVVLTVADRGAGMRRADVQRAFEPFWRADAGETPGTGDPAGLGMGLGLPIARRLVEEQAGWMELRSALGVGTEIEVWLPEGG
jgi:hypothetical protein